jgi:site-specific recombinase XerD
MQAFSATSFTEAALAWIHHRDSRLSSSTERAYRGEIDRMAQFFAAKYGGLNLGEFTSEHWQDYIEELQGERRHVFTCREKQLSPSSAAQAIRVSAAFLRWARDDGLLSWAPKTVWARGSNKITTHSRQPLVNLSVESEPLHPALAALLMKEPAANATQEMLRAQLAVGLAYWGGLRSSEIAMLRCGDIAIKNNAIELRHPRLKRVITIHGNVVATWHQYRTAREKAIGPLTQRSPIVAALRLNEPISSWSVWSLIAQHTESLTGIEKLYSAQSLRRARITAMAEKCALNIKEISKYSRRSRVDFSTAFKR